MTTVCAAWPSCDGDRADDLALDVVHLLQLGGLLLQGGEVAAAASPDFFS